MRLNSNREGRVHYGGTESTEVGQGVLPPGPPFLRGDTRIGWMPAHSHLGSQLESAPGKEAGSYQFRFVLKTSRPKVPGRIGARGADIVPVGGAPGPNSAAET